MKLSIAEQDLTEINGNLLYLSSMEKDLIYNLGLAKDPKIITTINGFQKSRKQLKQVGIRKRQYRNKRTQVLNSIVKYEEMSTEAYDEIDEIYAELESEKKILLFKRRDTDGQK